MKHVSRPGSAAEPKRPVISFRMQLPGNYFAQGEVYLEAAIALSKTPPRLIGAEIPLFFCIAQATELFFKSFLAANGKDRALAGWTTHDLAKLQSAATQLGLILKDTTQATITEIAKQNRAHEFRFLDTTRELVLPPPRCAIKAVTDIKTSVLDTVQPFMRVREK